MIPEFVCKTYASIKLLINGRFHYESYIVLVDHASRIPTDRHPDRVSVTCLKHHLNRVLDRSEVVECIENAIQFGISVNKAQYTWTIQLRFSIEVFGDFR